MDFGERLKAFREAARMTRADLAARLQIAETSVRKVEAGESKSLTLANGIEAAWLLEVWPDELTRAKPFRSPLVLDFEGSRVEVRIRIHGDADSRRVLAAMRAALAGMGPVPETDLAALEAHLEAALLEVRRVRA